MIAKVVVDLPLEEPFDYLIPPALENKVVRGVRVRVSFGARIVTGFVVALNNESSIEKIKPIKSLIDQTPIFDQRDLNFAKIFAGYYGCSVGEALAVMMRHRKQPPFALKPNPNPRTSLFHCVDGYFQEALKAACATGGHYFVLVADMHRAKMLGKEHPHGMRSSMFEAFAQKSRIIVIDEDDDSFKQEQSPMYETRHVVLMAQRVYGFDVVFISQTPSVELMQLVNTKAIEYTRQGHMDVSPTVIDTTNYKYLDKGILSVPVRNALEANIKAQKPTLLLFNRRGTFSVTRCATCHYVLKCPRCASAMAYSAAKHVFNCHQCLHQMKDAGQCPTCKVASWKSFGMGLEKAQKEIANLFPTAHVSTYETASERITAKWDVMIATVAILNFQQEISVETVAVIEIDTALNRLEMQSSFKVWRMLRRLQTMGKKILVQTRNLDHPMLKAFTSNDEDRFYREELSMRQELNFAPFYHWVALVMRSKKEKNALRMAQDVYNCLKQSQGALLKITEVMPDTPAKLRDQYRFRLMVGGQHVPDIIKHIKTSMQTVKRISGVICTLNIDP